MPFTYLFGEFYLASRLSACESSQSGHKNNKINNQLNNFKILIEKYQPTGSKEIISDYLNISDGLGINETTLHLTAPIHIYTSIGF